MFAAMEVFRCVLVLRGVTTADVSAFQAETQVDPGVTGLKAVFADVFVGTGELDLIEVTTFHDVLHCA
jgi:hypothetical protein